MYMLLYIYYVDAAFTGTELIFDFDLDCWNAKNVLCTAVTMSVIGRIVPSQQVTISVIGRIVPSALQNSHLEEAILEPISSQGMDYAIQTLSRGKVQSTILIHYS